MFDVIIIGGGPAGITAAVYAARKRMKTLVITRDIGGQAAWSGDVENYPGYQFISGPELVRKFEEHMRHYEVPIKEGETVMSIEKTGDTVRIKTDKDAYETRSVVIASGKRSRELGVPGEKEYKNKGVAYCATCDGPLFSGKDVAVIGGGNSGLDAAIQMSKIAKKVYLIAHAELLTGDTCMQEAITKADNVVMLLNTEVRSIRGDKFVTGIVLLRKGNEEVIPLQAVFIEIGLIPNSEFAGLIKKNERKEIIVNCACETNVPGVFAAGDVTNVPDKQIIIAAGEGSKALLGAFRYLVMNSLLSHEQSKTK